MKDIPLRRLKEDEMLGRVSALIHQMQTKSPIENDGKIDTSMSAIVLYFCTFCS